MLKFVLVAARALVGAHAGAETVRIGGSGSALGVIRLQAEAFHATGTQTRITVLQALYAAKKGGRNRTVVSANPEPVARARRSRERDLRQKQDGRWLIAFALQGESCRADGKKTRPLLGLSTRETRLGGIITPP